MRYLTILGLLCSLAQARDYATGLIKPVLPSSHRHIVFSAQASLPASLDLRDKLTPIRNQGQCGSCWAFSTTAAAESFLALNGSILDLAEQQVNDCDSQSGGCNGGYFTGLDVIVKGVTNESNYPYRAYNQRCHSPSPVAHADSWAFVGKQGEEPTTEEIKVAIIAHPQALSVTVAADNAFMNYSGGVYDRCGQGQTNHMTNIVGWDDAGQYWIMRNSWGADWGDKGYMKIKWTDSRGRKCNRIGEEAAVVLGVKPE